MIERDKLFVGGRWIAPSGKDSIDVHHAGTGQVMGRIPAGNATARHAVARSLLAARAATRLRTHSSHRATGQSPKAPTARTRAQRPGSASTHARPQGIRPAAVFAGARGRHRALPRLRHRAPSYRGTPPCGPRPIPRSRAMSPPAPRTTTSVSFSPEAVAQAEARLRERGA